MTTGAILIILALATPVAAAGLMGALARAPDARDAVTVVTGLVLTALTTALLLQTAAAPAPELVLSQPVAGAALAFKLDPLGAAFALSASFLWLLNSFFSIGYMRGKEEPRQTPFNIRLALAMTATIGVAAAANLITLLVFYEALTLITYPLVTHRGGDAANAAGRLYIGQLMGASFALLAPAVVGVWAIVGNTDFTAGGALDGRVSPWQANVLIALFTFGFAKAAVPPLHRWLPGAMVAPTPVSSMLHAVAVVNAGVFGLLKTCGLILGPRICATTTASGLLLWLLAATILLASIAALRQDNLKLRLAWSTVAHLACVSAGALLAGHGGVLAGGVQMLTQSFGKIALFMCAGAIEVATGVTLVSGLTGLGRRMPLVFSAFLLASLSIVALPPFAGFWSKFLLASTAFAAAGPEGLAMQGGALAAAIAILASSLLSAFYLLPIAARALAAPIGAPPAAPFVRSGGAPGLAVAPALIAALATVVLFFAFGPVADFLSEEGAS